MRLVGAGLSPLARGNPKAPKSYPIAAGPIPARTGQPACFANSHCGQWAYPRSHGATLAIAAHLHFCKGLSPLARGNLEGVT